MKYPHWIVITAQVEGGGGSVQDPESGTYQPSPDDTELILASVADIQDEGRTVLRGQDVAVEESDATVYVPEDVDLWGVEEGMVVSCIFDPGTEAKIRDALVDRVTLLDNKIRIRYL